MGVPENRGMVPLDTRTLIMNYPQKGTPFLFGSSHMDPLGENPIRNSVGADPGMRKADAWVRIPQLT